MVPVLTTQINCGSTKAAIDNMLNEYGSILIKPCMDTETTIDRIKERNRPFYSNTWTF